MQNKAAQLYAKLKPGEKRIFWITAALLSFVFVDRVIVLPVTTMLTNLNTNLHEQEAAIKKSMSVLLHKEAIVAENREYAGYSVEAKNPEEEMVGLLREVESLAERSGVTLIFVKPSTTKEEKGVKKYYCTLEFESPMEQVATFFHSVESSTKLLKIEKYTVQPKGKESSTARCAVTIYKTVLS